MTGYPLSLGPLDAQTAAGSRIAGMQLRLAIGDFSRMTHLSVKALRHYHDVGLLEPAEIDPSSGYRFYAPAQVQTAQVIRRFRDLDMPIDEIREMLTAPDVATRNAVIVAHMQRMESQLAVTQAAVASLRSLLERPPSPIAVQQISAGPVRGLSIAEHVTLPDMEAWWVAAFAELDQALQHTGVTASGPRAALYPSELFELEAGLVVAYVPVPVEISGAGRAVMTQVPAAELALAVHRGPFADLDQTYAALGTYVAEREIGVDGPIRELYLVGPWDTGDDSQHVTEVCWPIFQTAPSGG